MLARRRAGGAGLLVSGRRGGGVGGRGAVGAGTGAGPPIGIQSTMLEDRRPDAAELAVLVAVLSRRTIGETSPSCWPAFEPIAHRLDQSGDGLDAADGRRS